MAKVREQRRRATPVVEDVFERLDDTVAQVERRRSRCFLAAKGWGGFFCIFVLGLLVMAPAPMFASAENRMVLLLILLGVACFSLGVFFVCASYGRKYGTDLEQLARDQAALVELQFSDAQLSANDRLAIALAIIRGQHSKQVEKYLNQQVGHGG